MIPIESLLNPSPAAEEVRVDNSRYQYPTEISEAEIHLNRTADLLLSNNFSAAYTSIQLGLRCHHPSPEVRCHLYLHGSIALYHLGFSGEAIAFAQSGLRENPPPQLVEIFREQIALIRRSRTSRPKVHKFHLYQPADPEPAATNSRRREQRKESNPQLRFHPWTPPNQQNATTNLEFTIGFIPRHDIGPTTTLCRT